LSTTKRIASAHMLRSFVQSSLSSALPEANIYPAFTTSFLERDPSFGNNPALIGNHYTDQRASPFRCQRKAVWPDVLLRKKRPILSKYRPKRSLTT
jgi:hypothetical protein